MLLLIGVTVALSAAVGTLALGLPGQSAATVIALSVEATANDARIVVVHEAGPPLDVRELRLRVAIDGTPLEYQPPVPFFAADGFQPGPTGPFNVATDPGWESGERASLKLASSNAPPMIEGATVTIDLYQDGLPVATAEATVR